MAERLAPQDRVATRCARPPPTALSQGHPTTSTNRWTTCWLTIRDGVPGVDRGPDADEGFPCLEPHRHLAWQRVHAVPAGCVRNPLLLHRFREEHVVLEGCSPSIVAARHQFVALVVDQRQEHAHSVPLGASLDVVGADLFPAEFLHLLGIRLRALSAGLSLCEVTLPGSPTTSRPGANRVHVRAQSYTTGAFHPSPCPQAGAHTRTRRSSAVLESRGTRQSWAPESGMSEAPDRLAQNGDPWVVDKVGDDDETMLRQVGQPLRRSPGSRKVGFGICKRLGSVRRGVRRDD